MARAKGGQAMPVSDDVPEPAPVDSAAARVREFELQLDRLAQANRQLAEREAGLRATQARKDGLRVPVMSGAAPVDRSRDHGVAYVQDITARRRADVQLRESEARFGNMDADVSPRPVEARR